MRWFYILVVSIILTAVLVGLQRLQDWPRDNPYFLGLLAVLLVVVLVSLFGYLTRMGE